MIKAQSQRGSARKIKISPTCLCPRVGWDEARILEIESNSRYPYGMLNQSDQPTRNLLGGEGWEACKADLTAICEPIV
jgi:hypothetical protein